MTTAVRQTSGTYGWMRTLVLTVAIALLGMTLLPPAARAEANQGITANAAFQVSLCKAGGGTAQTIDSQEYTMVMCHGGVYDGMICINDGNVRCWNTFPQSVSRDAGSQIWQIDEVIPVLESESPEQITDVLADLDGANGQEPGAGARVDSGNTQDHQAVTPTEHKQGKHGKKGGKHHKH